MKKESAAKRGADMRKEYDLSKLEGVRDKYYRRATAGTNLAPIEHGLGSMFPDSHPGRALPNDGARVNRTNAVTRYAGSSAGWRLRKNH